MKIQTIDSQAWWISLADELRPTEGWDGPSFITTIAKAFEFSDLPKQVADGGGFDFINGFYRDGGQVNSIPKLVLYNDGINVNVQGRTSVAEAVLQRTLEIAFSFGIRPPTTTPLHHYLSTIVVDLDKSLDNIVPKSFLDMISASSAKGNAQFLSIAFNPDKTKGLGPMPGVTPNSFSIGRRVDVPYDQNRYFSQASMTTEKHIEIIEHLQALI
ncbi:hypothetical protein NB311A_01410 [Nitrobacter sp. Nb-311A]|uniref:hypothetical protein n=1 Tax=Nitrobacter sp. Nb-311A TaxID=314253 RepID=UPI00006866E0|nr:hypothetical protein [Nitrobacter sp. Nb-311A]EAQ35988.1 hypothetical protein NB311A_01410 [Nitrobacter sp. Nb-311A]